MANTVRKNGKFYSANPEIRVPKKDWEQIWRDYHAQVEKNQFLQSVIALGDEDRAKFGEEARNLEIMNQDLVKRVTFLNDMAIMQKTELTEKTQVIGMMKIDANLAENRHQQELYNMKVSTTWFTLGICGIIWMVTQVFL